MTPLKLQLSAPVRSVKILQETAIREPARHVPDDSRYEQNIRHLNTLCSALQQAITGFQRLHEELFLSHRDQIVRLSVEIAAKILARDIRNRNYEIENIIAEAMKPVDVAGQVTIRLNPEDLKTFKQAIENKKIQLPEKSLFVDDSVVNNAECIIETSEGIVEYLIQEHLVSIENALLEKQVPIEQV